jgi:protein-tyrosine phosphatase
MSSILVVCTGNICRSPLAEGFLRRDLRERLLDSVEVSSAGTAGWEGEEAMRESVLSAAERDVDISGHIARRLLRDHVEAADLVLAMAGEHRDAIVRSMNEAAPKTFTLKELVRLLEELPRPAVGDTRPDGALTDRLREAHLHRSRFAGGPEDEDIPDPLGQRIESYRAVASELEEWCRRLVDGLFGPVSATAAVAGEGE